MRQKNSNSMMVDINPSISVIILNINRLNLKNIWLEW